MKWFDVFTVISPLGVGMYDSTEMSHYPSDLLFLDISWVGDQLTIYTQYYSL